MHSDNVTTTGGESPDRKTTKPVMEKRRRARINASLAELKSLLLEVIKREGARHSKMEKADILEMTVRHLRDMQRQDFTGASANEPSTSDKHRLGFSECTQEVSRYLSNIEGCDVELRTRLLDHLANYVSSLDPNNCPSPPVTSHPMTPPPAACSLSVPSGSHIFSAPSQELLRMSQIPQATPSPSDVNNNLTILSTAPRLQPASLVSGLQVIPAKLQTGEIAFVLPGSSTGSNQITNYIIPIYTSPTTTPAKPTSTVTMTTGGTSQASFMTIVPSAGLLHTSTVSPGNIGTVSKTPTAVVSPGPCSTITSSMLSLPSTSRIPDNGAVSIKDEQVMKRHDITDLYQRSQQNNPRLGDERQLGIRGVSVVRHFDVSDPGGGLHHRSTDNQDDRVSGEVPRVSVSDFCEVRQQDVMDLSKRHHHDVRDIGEIRHGKEIRIRQVDTCQAREVRHHDVRDIGHARHEDERNQDGASQVREPHHPEEREGGGVIRREENPEANVWRPW